MSSDDWAQLCSRKMLIVIPSRLQSCPSRSVARFGPEIGRIEQIELRSLEMGCRQAVGDQDDLAVRRVLPREELPAHLQGVLDIREMRRDLHLAHIWVAHVGPQSDVRIEDRHRLRHQRRHVRRRDRLREGVHLDELQKIARIFAANQSFERQAHALDVDVLTAVAHRAAHIHQHGGGAFRRVARAVDFDILGLHAHRNMRAIAEHRVDQRRGNIHLRDRIAELVGLRLLQFDRPVAYDGTMMPARGEAIRLAKMCSSSLLWNRRNAFGVS